MSWRVVVVSEHAKIDFKVNYLVVRKLDGTIKIHISEIGVLIVESTAVSITAYTLCELIEKKIKVIFCDHLRNPCSELVPCSGCHDSCDKIRRQMLWQVGAKQSVWTEIVREKIKRQSEHLCRRGLEQHALLDSYIEQLEYNDKSNREGHAAKVYFNALFGLQFTRADDCPINAALNYGYSIILSAINREISAAGYLNQLGIFHDNTYNPYNFGCDLMEPLRPLVDCAAYDLMPEKFEHEEKMNFVNLLNNEVIVDNKKQYLLFALRIYCSSVFKALQNGDVSEIKWIRYEL
ncbi:MAG: type II CRISPR-associated endonuclease Cas1 [Ruminococcaceae bacterium]|nr:type II CRISPR-associated endonuclease Cas1 [Oscillospiraceae bacterium]